MGRRQCPISPMDAPSHPAKQGSYAVARQAPSRFGPGPLVLEGDNSVVHEAEDRSDTVGLSCSLAAFDSLTSFRGITLSHPAAMCHSSSVFYKYIFMVRVAGPPRMEWKKCGSRIPP
jgi:hypothetical protein